MHICIDTCVYKHIDICVYIHICVCVYIYIHIYVEMEYTKYTPVKFVFLFYNKAVAQRYSTPAFK